MSHKITSWGRAHTYEHDVRPINSAADIKDYISSLSEDDGVGLAYGNGRSYGDSNLNEDGLLLGTGRVDAFL